MKRILLTGKDGQVGWELQRALANLGQLYAFDSEGLNLADPYMVRSVVQSVHPHVIVNAGAYTAVDKAEAEPDIAMSINAKGPAVLAEEAKRCGSILVHYSTDYVFDGQSTVPYSETAIPNPLSAYGRSKLEGEKAIVESRCKHLVFRTSWVYGNRGKNFLLTMLNLARTKPALSIVDDQIGAPTWSRSIAEATAQALIQTIWSKNELVWGIYHMTCAESTSWFGFAKEIFQSAHAMNPDFNIPELTPIPTSGYPAPAKRPLYSVMDNHKIQNNLHISLPSWKKALELCLQDRTSL